MQEKTSIVFVIDPPGLVLDAILLMASIRAHMQHVHVVPYCPEHRRERIPYQLTEFFEHMNAPIQFMDTEGYFEPHYKQGNKLIALAQPRSTEYTLFLDTDTMVMRPFNPAEILQRQTLSACPEGVYTWGKGPKMWPTVYAMFGLEVPEERIRLAKSGALSPPYFNAGVVGFENKTADGRSFAEVWMETAQLIDANKDIPQRRPWLDQISLPIAAKRAGYMVNVLEKEWNLSLTHKRIDEAPNEHKKVQAQKVIDNLNQTEPAIIHYHNRSAMSDLKYCDLPDKMVVEFTCFESFHEMHSRMLSGTPSRDDILSNFHRLRAIEGKTADEIAQLKDTNEVKRQMQSGEIFNRYYEQWPISILRKL